jgi:hypothetical protein
VILALGAPAPPPDEQATAVPATNNKDVPRNALRLTGAVMGDPPGGRRESR